MLETYLELLHALQDGDHSLPTLAEAIGLSETETREAMHQLHEGGFLGTTAGVDEAGAYHLLPAGRVLLRLGTDEAFKRALAERLGGADDSAS